MEAGEFRHRVALQKPMYTQNQTTGEMVETWLVVGTVWAAIRPLRATELVAAQATQSKVTTTIIIRFRSDIEPTWRIVHMVNGTAGRVYNIEGILQDKLSGREHIVLPCSSGLLDPLEVTTIIDGGSPGVEPENSLSGGAP
jgi:SPP1 family predicted phage head-tail adaptor